MDDNLTWILEAERRGILPPERQQWLDEARKRGLLKDDSVNPAGLAKAGAAGIAEEGLGLAMSLPGPSQVLPYAAAGAKWGLEQAGYPETAESIPTLPRTGPQVVEGIKDVTGIGEGAEPGSFYDPQNAPERYTKTTMGDLVYAPAMGVGGAIAMGLMSEAGGDIAANTLGEEYRPYGQFVGAMASGVRSGPKAQPAPNPVADAAARIAPSMPRATAGGPTAQSIAGKLKEIPIVGSSLTEQSGKAMAELEAAKQGTVSALGSGQAQVAGATGRAALTSYIKSLSKNVVSPVYDKIDDLVANSNIRTRLTATEKVVGDISRERMASHLPQSDAAKIVGAAVNDMSGLSYSGIKHLRTYIGEMMDTGLLPSNISGGELKRIYGALTEDLGMAASKAGGPKAYNMWKKANKIAAMAAERKERLAKILNAPNDEKIVSNIAAYASTSSRADLQLLRMARRAAGPQAWDEMSSAVIQELGGIQGQWSPQKFATAWNKMTPQGRQILFGSTGKAYHIKTLDDIALLSEQAKKAAEYANRSQSGAVATSLGLGAWAIADPVSALTAAITGKVVAQYLSRPIAARAISKWGSVWNKTLKYGQKSSWPVYMAATAELAKTLAKEANLPEIKQRIEKELHKVAPQKLPLEVQGVGPAYGNPNQIDEMGQGQQGPSNGIQADQY